MFQTPFPSEQFGYSDREKKPSTEPFVDTNNTTNDTTNDTTNTTNDITNDTTNDTVADSIQDNCVVESTDSRACGLRVKLLMDNDDPNNDKTGTVIKVSGTQFSVSLDNENTIITVSTDNIQPLFDINQSPTQSQSRTPSQNNTKQTLTSPPKSLLDLSVKQLGYRTIKVWNDMFQEVLQHPQQSKSQNQDQDQETIVTDINGERVELNDLEQWWMNPYQSLQHVLTVLTRDDRLVYTGLFFVMLSFFCYFILVTN